MILKPQAALPGKSEIELQFMDDDTLEREDEALVEMRLYVAPEHELAGVDMAVAGAAATTKAKARRRAAALKAAAAAGVEAPPSEGDSDVEDTGDASAVLHSLISDAAGVHGSAGEPIAILPLALGQVSTVWACASCCRCWDASLHPLRARIAAHAGYRS